MICPPHKLYLLYDVGAREGSARAGQVSRPPALPAVSHVTCVVKCVSCLVRLPAAVLYITNTGKEFLLPYIE